MDPAAVATELSDRLAGRQVGTFRQHPLSVQARLLKLLDDVGGERHGEQQEVGDEFDALLGLEGLRTPRGLPAADAEPVVACGRPRTSTCRIGQAR